MRADGHARERVATQESGVVIVQRQEARRRARQNTLATNSYRHSPIASKGRLEPNPLLEDPSDFESISEFPTPVLFWRSRSETLARHNNPIFNQGLGITPRRCLTVDGLHAVYLGIMLVFCRHVVWVVLTSNLWRGGVGTQEENIEAGLEVLRYTLTQWYKERARLHPEEELTRISKVTRKMVGKSGKRKLKTKAA